MCKITDYARIAESISRQAGRPVAQVKINHQQKTIIISRAERRMR
jgi:hypothetical protein